jgi:hypothetical protein
VDIKVSPKRTANVQIGEDSYKVRVPTVLQAEKYFGDIKQDEGSGQKVIELLVELGLPKGVCEDLDILQMSEILEGLTSLTKKK